MSDVIVEVKSTINEVLSKTFVTQTFENTSDDPLELQIFVYNNFNLIFNSFTAQVGNAFKVKSKIIKKEKTEEKYSDAIAKGNAAIFVRNDPVNNNILVIHMGNIPPKEKVIFESEFIGYLEKNGENYEFELFRNLPLFNNGYKTIYKNKSITGDVTIKTIRKISEIKEEILYDELKITEKKWVNEDKKEYIYKYEIQKLPEIDMNRYDGKDHYDFIPCSKIKFNLEIDEKLPIIYKQKSSINKNEINYLLKYKNITKEEEDDNEKDETYPALFIFLIDQSGSMEGDSIQIVRKALNLFLQSLPVGSYYQLIGFGTKFNKYDNAPREYTRENIQESFEIIKNLKADMGGTDIYGPLDDIYSSVNNYKDIDLPKNIFLLTDGEIEKKEQTLRLIENNNLKFMVYSIGIGKDFDKDLIKSSGMLGRGGYEFCPNLDELNKIIISEVDKVVQPYLSKFTVNCQNLTENNLLKNAITPKIIRKNETIDLSYIIDKKNDKENEKIKIEINYNEDLTGKKQKNLSFDVEPIELPEGEELSKLIIKKYIQQNYNTLNEEDKRNYSLQYKILTEVTSLFAEIESNNIIKEKMKLDNDKNHGIIGEDDMWDDDDCENECYISSGNEMKESCMIYDEEKEKEEKRRKEEKDKIMKMIGTQDMIDGFWILNNETKIIKDKYSKEYNSLMELKDKKVTENVAVTIIILLFITKEHQELVGELKLIMKKAKKFIMKETNLSYENLIKEIGIN